jgi:hypothetical protein
MRFTIDGIDVAAASSAHVRPPPLQLEPSAGCCRVFAGMKILIFDDVDRFSSELNLRAQASIAEQYVGFPCEDLDAALA